MQFLRSSVLKVRATHPKAGGSGFAAGRCPGAVADFETGGDFDFRAKQNRPAAAGRLALRCALLPLVCCACYRWSLISGSRAISVVGGAEEIRTPDLRRAKAALSQLSYDPIRLTRRSHQKWARLDSNQGPRSYQDRALTT